MKKMLVVLLVAICLAAVLGQPVFASALLQDASPQKSGGLPILGILVLLAPFAFMIYRSRGKKEIDQRTSGACLPIIDDSKRPFQPVEDESPDEKSG